MRTVFYVFDGICETTSYETKCRLEKERKKAMEKEIEELREAKENAAKIEQQRMEAMEKENAELKEKNAQLKQMAAELKKQLDMQAK